MAELHVSVVVMRGEDKGGSLYEVPTDRVAGYPLLLVLRNVECCLMSHCCVGARPIGTSLAGSAPNNLGPRLMEGRVELACFQRNFAPESGFKRTSHFGGKVMTFLASKDYF